MQLNGLPKPLTGSEPVTIQQTENGHTSVCTMPLSDLLNQINAAAPAWWVASLPTILPPKPGVLWNNTGMLSVS
ncbi:hypothetical protein R69608_05147 [Paraburkholderia nemoris]|uniref:hypothetical protein n=1 Tax=Paraburkholderia nemoris TaxID=2793076 RepID=UPI0019113C66|nr:hypothetical protein [Paraburkholderia nemoris]MBK5149651.1 hypothetical protein [Burkholderia sp. R-69608]CAE6939303.1 hypothetical protein R69608_05147 [Paraburkholderia nemoris]